jgi:acetylornithine deacetylase/succinyl-diaminopimelate desuccinylase-like protein
MPEQRSRGRNRDNSLHPAQSATELSETVRIAQDLIRIDTTNHGQGNANPERPAADYVCDFLHDLGLSPQVFESAPGRATVVCHVPGENADLPALVLHGHLDVVPAVAESWSVDPFAGEIKDGLLWGRGAVDMKNMDAMMLTAIAELLRANKKPNRNTILVFFADEENGGAYGSVFMVREHPEVFAGAKTAISEVGGYSVYLGGERAYLLQTGEKALDWVKLRARGVAQHGSRIVRDNAIVKLARAVQALGSYEWPIELGDTTRALLHEIEALTGPGDPDELMSRAGSGAGFLFPSLRTTTNPTVLNAGYMHNVVPDTAEALVDIRSFPGKQEQTLELVQDIVGEDIEIERLTTGVGMETPFYGELVDTVKASLQTQDPDAKVLPYLLSAGTDNKSLSSLGIIGYGFVPLKLPPELDFPAMFHGVDERVPLESIDFGHRVLLDFLERY